MAKEVSTMVKVIVERKVKKGKEAQLMELLREVKSAATLYPGYISGETMTSIDDPSLFLVIANFTDLESFKKWRDNPARLKVTAKIDALLEYPAKIGVYKVGG
jgi:antibiotic biosynthesis monooxygenase (ABM) superfamily enzyme